MKNMDAYIEELIEDFKLTKLPIIIPVVISLAILVIVFICCVK